MVVKNNISHPYNGVQKKYTTDFNGDILTIEVGTIGFRSTASLILSYKDLVLMCNISVDNDPSASDFFPLMVEFEEKFYATGKINGSRYIKREGRPTDTAVLTSRLIDRSIRPLFPKDYRNPTQVVITTLSIDETVSTDIFAVLAASIGLVMSGSPIKGLLSSIKIAEKDGKTIINPGKKECEEANFELIVSGVKDKILMVEAIAGNVANEKIVNGIKTAIKEWQPIAALLEEVRADYEVKSDYIEQGINQELVDLIQSDIGKDLGENVVNNKLIRDNKLKELENSLLLKYVDDESRLTDKGEHNKYSRTEVELAFEQVVHDDLRALITNDHLRPDGRKPDEVREISVDSGLLPRTHGSALFTRGATQTLAITTIAPLSYSQEIDQMDEEESKRFMHHYNFAPYSVGDVRPIRSTNRREIGHGSLAEKAIESVLPSIEDFPYAIRVVNEITSSSGSTSMASVCGASMSLMNAGVPIKSAVSGIAMGLLYIDEDTSVILTDIQDVEDFAGDMDFKVAGTRGNISALQMDIKLSEGLSIDILEKALSNAQTGKDHILDEMNKHISEVGELSKHAPRIESMQINVDLIKKVIGKGGDTINKIIEDTGVEIDINDDGLVMISSKNLDDIEKAKNIIAEITSVPEVGSQYEARVVSIKEFGAFVRFLGEHEGLVHISQFSNERLENLDGVVSNGDMIRVELTSIDDKGRYQLKKV